jgi:hypothetical protein
MKKVSGHYGRRLTLNTVGKSCGEVPQIAFLEVIDETSTLDVEDSDSTSPLGRSALVPCEEGLPSDTP